MAAGDPTGSLLAPYIKYIVTVRRFSKFKYESKTSTNGHKGKNVKIHAYIG
jgi:hypothetical protein